MNVFWQFAMSHWQLFGCLVLILVMILVFEIKMKGENAPSLTTQEAIEWINRKDAFVVDIRPQEAFRKGHILNSQSVEPNAVVKMLTEGKGAAKYKGKPILVICTQGIQAQKTAALLKKAGMADVAILKGGINSWISADLPLEKSK